MCQVNEYLAGAGADAPDVEEEHIVSRPSGSYDDMWAKTLLEKAEVDEDDGRSSGNSSPKSTGSVETSISSHFGGMNYPSLFSSKPSYGTSLDRYGASRFSTPSTTGPSIYEGSSSPIREEPPSYESSVMRRFESFENPLAGQSIDYQEENRSSSGNLQFAIALYDFTAGGDDELNLTAGEEVEIEYEVDGWFYVKKKRPGRDGKMAGLVPVLTRPTRAWQRVLLPVGKELLPAKALLPGVWQGRMVWVGEKFYCMGYSPYSVLAYDVGGSSWSKIQALPMRRFLRRLREVVATTFIT
ncbi:hypothetical protein MLD38_036673 [Melastoma candidum]|uniref:Uncharacterized protein n=2 Tax=Melastoma candidum TaxID=119954 RepID=A0ACB9LK94_9MYRT|nr:hypothetical protein MLD38_036672 [Melastoma candidum]KAI4311807.1 hypothetical protein MLD38_036673 [Melastoma candidum]